jgi:hypothetical protein
MPTNKSLKRLQWFNYGVEALIRARPAAPRVYGCPICLRGFDDPNAMTLEHIPPGSIGGRQLVLTCKDCNNRSGTMLDAHIRTGLDLREIAQGKQDIWIKLNQFGYTITAKVLLEHGKIHISGVPEKSHPEAHRSLFAKMNEVAETGSTDWGFSIDLPKIRHDPWRAAVGWLRVAYLYAFAALGYNFILRPELNIIREQLQRPENRVAPHAIQRIRNPDSEDGLSFVYSPKELRGVVVRLGVYLFFFPAFVEASTFYERLSAYISIGKQPTLSGTHVDLPRRPLFAFDYHPDWILLTVPPGERSGMRVGA